MDSKAVVLAELIDSKGSRRSFAEKVGIPPTTLQSILKRGVGNATIENMIKICRELGITVEQLYDMAEDKPGDIEIIAAHHDGEDWTEEEVEDIQEFKELLKLRRQLKKTKE